KFAARWRDKSGVPDRKELAAMKPRFAALRTDWQKARVVVLPSRAAGKHDTASSTRLAGLLQQELGGNVTAVPDGARLEVAADSNEQKRLWDLARGLRAALGKQAVVADYALVVDLGLDAARGAGFVHVVVCTAKGEFVLVDFQNDQHPLFQRLAPKTLEDCERLAVARLQELLR
ncbi:MAG: hypothetical protein Q7T30_00160, partial [Planctomycetota bacterium]|nr:hypothetical protein [Planctomycetota bacterium]